MCIREVKGRRNRGQRKMLGKIDREIIDWYLSREKRLCVLNCDKSLPASSRGKIPKFKRWTEKDERRVTIEDTALSGGNLGFILSACDVVVDVDPRHGGDASLKVLKSDLGGLDLDEICPVIETGGGGQHFYFSKNKGETIRKTSTRYPGIDFITNGGFVVIPGSYHYLNKKHYEFNELSAYDEKKFPPLPEAVLKHIRKERDPDEPLHRSCQSPNLTDEELELLLNQIDVEDFRGRHDEWLSLMFSCHQATNGDGRRAFVNWCMRDPKYAADEGLILYRWDTVLDVEENLVTYRTLMKAVREAGGEIPEGIDRKCKIAEFDVEEFSATADFDDTVNAIIEDEDDYGPADDTLRAEEYAKKEEIRKKTGQTKYEALMVLVSGLTNETVTSDKIEKIAKLCKGFDEITVGKIQGAICKYAKLMLPNVKRSFAQTKRDETKREAFDNIPKDIVGPLECFTGDIVPIAVAMILKQKFHHGHTICKGQDGGVWVYDGRVWAPFSPGEVDGITREALALADKDTGDLAKSMQKCKVVLLSVLRTVDFTKPVSDRFDIFNFPNCEIWVDASTGKKIRKPHSFKSLQTSMHAYDFDKDAKCQTFSNILPGILSCYGQNSGDVERHLWELYGYTLTSKKNIAAFIALTGPGGNGKSQILNALSAVLRSDSGSRAVFGSLTDFGSGKSTHAFAQLVGKLAFIDDDAEYGAKLPSDVLKKVSENKMLTSNPKYKNAFVFENQSICWLASNSWPYTGDTSNGIRRRAHILNLTNVYTQGENADSSIPEKIKNEAPGIFNRMIEGLIRFRKRGFFEMPAELHDTAAEWEVQTNPVAAFLYKCDISVLSKITITYDAYKEFCYEQGRGDKISSPKMQEMLTALGCRIVNGSVIVPDRFLKSRK